MDVVLKAESNSFTAEQNPEGVINVMEFDARQGKVHIGPGEYLIRTSFGEAFAVTKAQFEEHFVEVGAVTAPPEAPKESPEPEEVAPEPPPLSEE